MLNSCRIWSPTGLNTPHTLPATHCLCIQFCTLTQGRGGGVEFSASHLLLRGVAGYMADYMEEVGRINAVFRGGLICAHGIPILSSRIKDSSLVRAILELGEWLKISAELFPQKSWMALSSLILLEKCNGSFVTEIFRHPMPIKVSYFTRSWVSGGWTSPSGVQPCSPENEKTLVQTLVREVNSIFNAGLGSEPIMASGHALR